MIPPSSPRYSFFATVSAWPTVIAPPAKLAAKRRLRSSEYDDERRVAVAEAGVADEHRRAFLAERLRPVVVIGRHEEVRDVEPGVAAHAEHDPAAEGEARGDGVTRVGGREQSRSGGWEELVVVGMPVQ